MASNYTANYGLCQWEPGDAFVRTEFNADNEKVDAALHAVRGETLAAAEAARTEALRAAETAQSAAERALAGLVPVNYNVCNLALQHYYDGKQTGWKRALLFDGFLDGGGIAGKSDALVLGAGKVTLSRSIPAAVELPNGSDYQYSSSSLRQAASVTATGGAMLHRLKLIWKADSSYQVGDLSLEFGFYVNGTLHHTESHSLHFTTAEQTGYVDLTTPVPVTKGDSVHFAFSLLSSYYKMPIVRGSNDLIYAAYCFRPTNAVSGSLTGTAAAMPACKGARGWVRHVGGTVAMKVKAGGVSRSLSAAGTRPAVGMQGEACTESEFALEASMGAGDFSVALTLSLGSDEKITLLDYGVVLW